MSDHTPDPSLHSKPEYLAACPVCTPKPKPETVETFEWAGRVYSIPVSVNGIYMSTGRASEERRRR